MRILSGIQPSGALHLGNYFGMMRPAIELQEKGEAFYFIADYHSMTSLFDAAERRKNTLDVALDFLACGLDPKRAVFFKQSDVPEVCELSWLLSTLTPMGSAVESRSANARTAGPFTSCRRSTRPGGVLRRYPRPQPGTSDSRTPASVRYSGSACSP
jgi:tryptophanyl-tRNA synthetase